VGLPNSYTMKNGAIASYFDAMLNASAPERFSYKFLEGLGFKSKNDRLFIGILKDLNFLNSDGAPQDRYYQFLDKSKSAHILAEAVKETFSDLFAVNTSAHTLSNDEAFNKLRTLYRGAKKDTVIKMIARTFVGLCEYSDFTKGDDAPGESEKKAVESDDPPKNSQNIPTGNDKTTGHHGVMPNMNSLQYHINIVLPDTRDQAVFDAIFKSLRDHLG